MRYSVELMPEPRRKIDGLGLSAHVCREVLKGLDELNHSPNRLLIRVGPPVDALQYDVVVSESEPSHRVHMFTFTIRHGVDEETIYVVELDYFAEDYPD